MSILEKLQKIKPFYSLFLIIVISSIFFELGRLSSLEERHTPINIKYNNATSTASAVTAATTVSTSVSGSNISSGEVIGSKSGKKYYFPWCGTVKRIKPENQVHFSSIEEARKAGFLPGGNCKGLK